MSKLRKSANGQPCQVRIDGVCSFDETTTVLAHLNGFRHDTKALDIHGAFACFNCHQWLDGGYAKDSSRDFRDLRHLQAVIRTQLIMAQEGLIQF